VTADEAETVAGAAVIAATVAIAGK